MKRQLYDLNMTDNWVSFAIEDIEHARMDFQIPRLSPRHAAFYIQQAIEKIFKSVFVSQGVEVQFTHDLLALKQQLPPNVQGLIRLTDEELQTISQWSALGRYPDPAEVKNMDRSDIEKVIEKSESCVTDIASHVRKTHMIETGRKPAAKDDNMLGR